MTFTVSLRNRESYLESIDVLNPITVSAIRTTLNRFDKFCESKYNDSEEEILTQLMKQNQDERIINACDVLQLWISNLSKTISPKTHPKPIT